MKIEILIYVIIAIFLVAVNRVIGGIKNGAFYAKGNKYNIGKLKKYVDNLHYAETPNWYTLFGALFFLIFSIFRLIEYNDISFWHYIRQFIAAMLVVMGTSGLASFHYQGYINLGAGDPFYNPKEDKMSEFALGNISFWWNRGFLDKNKKLIPIIGFFSIVIGLIIGFGIIF